MSGYLNPQLPKPVISCLGGSIRKQGHLTITTNTYIQITTGSLVLNILSY